MSKKCFFPFFLMKRLLEWFHFALKSFKIRVLPQSLLPRFILIILLPLILLQAIVVLFFYDRHWDTVSRRLAADVSGEIQTVADFILTQNPSQESLDLFFNSLSSNLMLKMTFDKNTYLTEQKTPFGGTTENLTSALLALKYPVNMAETIDRQQIISIQLPSGVLTTVVPRKRFFSSTVSVFLVWMIGSSILLFWIAFLFMKNQIRSIERLSRASELFGMGQIISFKPEGATEVKRAGASFVLMKNRIQKYLTERTAMLAGVSHDLRTPLTRMKLQLSMMPQDDSTKDLEADIHEMEQMLNGYLAFARGEGKEKAQHLNINVLIKDLVEKQIKSGQVIDLHQEENLMVSGRLNDLMRAFNNILTNAGRYATRTGVRIGKRNQMVSVVIDDNGPGIPEEKRADVFKAFYRLDESRNSETGGVGLGMTITKDIILSHGGDIQLSQSPLGGLRVQITLPLVQTQSVSKE